MGKVKCVKDFPCEQCNRKGMLQILSPSYVRVRHYLKLNEYGKPVFEYHRNSIEYINRILASKQINQSIDPIGQNNIDLKLFNNSSFTENSWAGSSVRIEHRPPKSAVVGSNPTPPVTIMPQTYWFCQPVMTHFGKSSKTVKFSLEN
jgi:hypothetical protein